MGIFVATLLGIQKFNTKGSEMCLLLLLESLGLWSKEVESLRYKIGFRPSPERRLIVEWYCQHVVPA